MSAIFKEETLQTMQAAREAMQKLMSDSVFCDKCLYTGQATVKNPAVTFTKDVKAGMYDDISDEEYYSLLQKVEKQATLFQRKAVLTLDYQTKWQELQEHLVKSIVILNQMAEIPQILTAMSEIETAWYDEVHQVETVSETEQKAVMDAYVEATEEDAVEEEQIEIPEAAPVAEESVTRETVTTADEGFL